MNYKNPLSPDDDDDTEYTPADDDGDFDVDLYRREYAEQRAAYASMSLTEAEYIASRKIEDGGQ